MKINICILVFLDIFLLFSCERKKEKTDPDTYYTCSMDPQVIEKEPGNCPICKMPLTPVKKSQVMGDSILHLSEQQIQLGNITVAPLKSHALGSAISLTGVLTVNQNKNVVVSTRVMGRIEKLYVRVIGEQIKKGQALYDIYSEDLNLTIRELKLALDKKNKFDRSDFDRMIESARKKLELFGLTKKQIDYYEKNPFTTEKVTMLSPESGAITEINIAEGGYVMEGDDILWLSDYRTLWAEAQVYSDFITSIKTGMTTTVYIPEKRKEIQGKINFIHPQLESPEVNLVRIEIPNENNELKPGMQVNFSILMSEFNSIALPDDAVIITEHGNVVWIQDGKNKFRSVMVQTGAQFNGFTEITSGLNKGDTVVMTGAYLLNSEFIFKKGINPMEGHNMSEM